MIEAKVEKKNRRQGVASGKIDEALRAKLHRMVQDDQDARNKVLAWMREHGQADPETVKKKEDVPEVKRVQDLDRKHTARLKEIVDKHGWPGKSLVGVGPRGVPASHWRN